MLFGFAPVSEPSVREFKSRLILFFFLVLVQAFTFGLADTVRKNMTNYWHDFKDISQQLWLPPSHVQIKLYWFAVFFGSRLSPSSWSAIIRWPLDIGLYQRSPKYYILGHLFCSLPDSASDSDVQMPAGRPSGIRHCVWLSWSPLENLYHSNIESSADLAMASPT